MPTYLHPSQRSLKTDQIGPSGHKNLYHVGVLEGNWFEERGSFGPQPGALASTKGGSAASLSGTSTVTPFTSTTTQRLSYVDCDTATRRGAKPMEATQQEAPRELLFAHGDTRHVVTSQFSVAELSYRGKAVPAFTHKEILSIEGTSPRRGRSNAKRSEASYEAEAAATGAEEFPASSLLDGTTTAGSDEGSTTVASTQNNNHQSKYHLPSIGAARTRERFTTSKNATIDTTGDYLLEHLKDVHEATVCNARGTYLTYLDASMHKTKLRY